MLGRKDYTEDELTRARTVIVGQLEAYDRLASAVAATGDANAAQALAAFEPLLTQALVVELDRFFVHRVRPFSGKDTNPLTEIELLTEAVLGDGTLRANKVIKYDPAAAVAGVAPGEPVGLSAAAVRALAEAYLDAVRTRSALVSA